MLNSEVPYVRCLDRSDREDVRLHQPRCANASTYGLRGYIDKHSPLSLLCITVILRVRRKFFEITMFPNTFFLLQGTAKRFLLPNECWLPLEAS